MKRTVSAAGFISEDIKRPWEGGHIRAYEFNWQFHHGKSLDRSQKDVALNLRTDPSQDFVMLRTNWDLGITEQKAVSGVQGTPYMLSGSMLNSVDSPSKSMESSIGDISTVNRSAFNAITHPVLGFDDMVGKNANNSDKTLLGVRLDQFYFTHLIPNCDVRQGCCLPRSYGKPTIEVVIQGGTVDNTARTYAYQFDQGYYDFPTLATNLQTFINATLAGANHLSASTVAITYDKNRGCCAIDVSALRDTGTETYVTTIMFPSYNESVENKCNRTVRTMMGLPPGTISDFKATSDVSSPIAITLSRNGYTPSSTGTKVTTSTVYGYQGVDMNRPKSVVVGLASGLSMLQNLSVDNIAGNNSVLAVIPLSQSFGELVFWNSHEHQNPVFVDYNSQDSTGKDQTFSLILLDERGAALVNSRGEWGGSGSLYMRNRYPVHHS